MCSIANQRGWKFMAQSDCKDWWRASEVKKVRQSDWSLNEHFSSCIFHYILTNSSHVAGSFSRFFSSAGCTEEDLCWVSQFFFSFSLYLWIFFFIVICIINECQCFEHMFKWILIPFCLFHRWSWPLAVALVLGSAYEEISFFHFFFASLILLLWLLLLLSI